MALIAWTYGAQAAPLEHLNLAQAQRLALAQAPRVRAARMALAVARDGIDVARANYLPQVTANLTAVDAGHMGDGTGNDDARIAAGGLNNPTVLSRAAGGIAIDQLVADFGHTSNLVASAGAAVEGRVAALKSTEADILLDVTRGYFQLLEAQAIRSVAIDALEARRQVSEKTSLLAQSKLKSSLDVSFADVAVEQARLLVLRAENDVHAATARLAAALGLREQPAFALDDDTPAEIAPPPALDELLTRAIAARPELARLRADREAASLLAKAARAKDYPEIDLHGVAGGTPAGDARFTDGYAAAGINVKVPLFDGYRNRSEAHAELHRAAELGAMLDDAENLVVRDVQVDWLDARANFETLGVTTRLRAAAQSSLDLAQASYGAGLTSIVELGQAQLNATESELAYARARYEYRIASATLDYATGSLE